MTIKNNWLGVVGKFTRVFAKQSYLRAGIAGRIRTKAEFTYETVIRGNFTLSVF